MASFHFSSTRSPLKRWIAESQDCRGCDCKLLNPLTDINGIRVLSRLGRPTRSSRAPHRHDSDARAVTRALYRGGRNHVGPANVLSCASRLQDPSPRQARRNRVDFRPKISSKHPLRRRRSPASRCSSVRSTWYSIRHPPVGNSGGGPPSPHKPELSTGGV